MSFPFRALAACAALLVATSHPAEGRSCTVAGNLVPNCGFDVDLAGWFFTTDVPTWVGDSCSTGPGCVTLDRWEVNGLTEAISTCMDVAPSTYWAYGASTRVDSGAVNSGCFYSLVQYSDPNCGVYLSETFYLRPAGPVWREQLGGLLNSAATESVQLRLTCSSNVDFVVRIDDFLYLPAVFLDGFDAGNSSAWSLTVP